MTTSMLYALCAVVAAQKLTAPQNELLSEVSGFYEAERQQGCMEAMALACRDEFEVQAHREPREIEGAVRGMKAI